MTKPTRTSEIGMSSVWKLLRFLSDKMKMGGAACLIGMSVLTCADVVGRLFKHPVFGSVELVSFMGVLAVAFALPHTHESNGHIGVELFVRKLPPRKRACIDLCTAVLSCVLFALVSWRMVLFGLNLMRSGEVSMNLKLPEYGIVFVVALCFLVLSATIIKGVIELIGQLRGK
ncbi:MAG: TRAP transporter small permease [Desulfobacteraceae bacterium]|nr:MAG: TRAP transporter small permease [Desulfobacteraceae bacterium]